MTSSSSLSKTSNKKEALREMSRAMIGGIFHFSLRTLSKVARYKPSIRSRLKKIKVIYNQPYGPLRPWHWLDIYEKHDRPPSLTHSSLKPAILYVHGGGFRILSKDTHWPFALMFAEAGFVVFNINYRLSPHHPCPAGLSDAALALLWLIDHADAYGVDKQQIYLAGESAGGHLVTALALACVRPAPYDWAHALFAKAQQGWRPRAILPACAFLDLQVQSPHRNHLSSFIRGRIEFLIRSYLSDPVHDAIANPLVEIESEQEFIYPLPPFFITVGSADFVVSDSERLALALSRRNVECIYKVYPKGIHAFHAVIWSKLAQQCWQDHFNFLATHMHEI